MVDVGGFEIKVDLVLDGVVGIVWFFGGWIERRGLFLFGLVGIVIEMVFVVVSLVCVFCFCFWVLCIVLDIIVILIFFMFFVSLLILLLFLLLDFGSLGVVIVGVLICFLEIFGVLGIGFFLVGVWIFFILILEVLVWIFVIELDLICFNFELVCIGVVGSGGVEFIVFDIVVDVVVDVVLSCWLGGGFFFFVVSIVGLVIVFCCDLWLLFLFFKYVGLVLCFFNDILVGVCFIIIGGGMLIGIVCGFVFFVFWVKVNWCLCWVWVVFVLSFLWV